MTKKILCILCIISCFNFFIFSAVKPEPVDDFEDTIELLREIEEEYRSEKWSSAKEDIKDLKKAIERMKEDIVNAGASVEVHFLIKDIDRLYNLVAEKEDLNTINKVFYKVQNQIIKIADFFDYEMPFILTVLIEQVYELKEEVIADEEWNEAYDELAEIDSIMEIVKTKYTSRESKKSIGKIETLIKDIRRIVDQKDVEGVIKVKRELVRTIEEFGDSL